jgi:uncharacterized OB-fold protein
MSTVERKYPAPAINPEIKPFFDAAAEGKLALKKCAACGQIHHYPRAICPFCASDLTEWTIVDCSLDAIRIGQRVKVVFKPTDGGPPVPMFAPA